MNTKKIFLPENEMPRQWYNIVADMPQKPLPPLDPKTLEPLAPEALEPILPKALIAQEMSQERYIDIPDEVLEKYRIYRPSPLFRASGLEKALGYSGKIYYKYEGVSPSGSHKPNTALAQAYYNKEEGIKKLTTETGAGQWGTALAYACAQFDLECEVYMVNVSYKQKPYRKILMNTFGANVYASPSQRTQAGRAVLEDDPNHTGSLGIAISEAVERAVQENDTKYSLGSVLNHVLLHQTIIGLETQKQLVMDNAQADVIVAPLGGGSNFAGLAFPFLKDKMQGTSNTRFVAVEPSSCPKLTQGKFRYDFGDNQGYTPLMPMYTLGHNFVPAGIHAGGLRYHGASVLCSQLLKDGFIEAKAIDQLTCFEAGILFAKAEGIVAAPESTHAIAQVIREVEQAKIEGAQKTIVFNLSGHGFVDMAAYGDYLDNKLTNHRVDNTAVQKSLDKIKRYQPDNFLKELTH